MRSAPDLFAILRSVGLPVGEYAVFGSGPLLVRGIIDETGDLDVLCRGAAWEQVMAIGDRMLLEDLDVEVYSIAEGAVTFGDRWAIGSFDVDHLIDTAETFDGIPFVRLEHVAAYKRIARRPKDVVHLELLQAYGATS